MRAPWPTDQSMPLRILNVVPSGRLASECYVVKKVVETPFGLRVRRITVCN